MATRGSLGGLSRGPRGDVLKLHGRRRARWILIETVGVGQTELDMMKLADTTVVVLVPESGDAIQTMKAGLMEAADMFVVNKADRAGAPALMAELRFAAHLHYASPTSPKDIDWEIPGAGDPGPDRRRAWPSCWPRSAVIAARWRRRARWRRGGARRRREELQALLVEELRRRRAAARRRRRSRATFDRWRRTPDPYSRRGT